MRATTILFWASALLASAGCGGGGGGAGAAAVGEPQATGASVAAALRVADALAELAGGRDVPALAAAGTACERGSLQGVCVELRGGNVLRLVARQCALRDAASGVVVTVDGRIAVSSATAFCGLGGPIPPEITRTYRLTNVRAEVVDGDGVAETFTADRLVETVQPLRSGCDLDDAILALDGGLTVQRRGRAPLALRARGLRLERRASGSAGQCVRTVTASGRLAVGAGGAARMEDAALDGFSVTVDAAGVARRLAGGLALSCARPFTVATDEPLTGGGACPSAGRLALERQDGSRGGAHFAAGAAEIDADGDGAADLAADCAALPRCGG